MAAVLTRCTARAGRYHATNSPGANLDSFSRPRSGEPQGGGEQLSTVKPGIRQANSLAWRRLNAPSSARGMKAPHSSKRPTLTSGPFVLKRLAAHDTPTPAKAVALRNTSCVSPFGPSRRNVQKRSRRFCVQALPGLHRFVTCLRQSNFVPDEVVAMLHHTPSKRPLYEAPN